jgi:hypothetical protein
MNSNSDQNLAYSRPKIRDPIDKARYRRQSPLIILNHLLFAYLALNRGNDDRRPSDKSSTEENHRYYKQSRRIMGDIAHSYTEKGTE